MRASLAVVVLALLTNSAVCAGGSKPQRKHVDFYGDPLPDGAVARLGTLRLRHARGVGIVALAPDGKVVASGDLTATRVSLWDTATGKELHRLDARGIPVDALEFSPDGRLLATACEAINNDDVVVWRVADGKELHRLAYAGGFVRFSKDGKQLLMAENKGAISWTIHYLDLDSGKMVRSWKAPPPPRTMLANQAERTRVNFVLAPDEKTVVWRFLEKGERTDLVEVNLFVDAATGNVRFRLAWPANQGMGRLVFAADAKQFAVAVGASPIRLYDTATGKIVRELNPGTAFPIVFSPDGKKLAWGDKAVFLEDLTTGQVTAVAPAARVPSALDGAVAFSADGKLLALAAIDRVALWNIESGREVHHFAGHGDEVFSVSFSGDGRHVYTMGGDPFAALTQCKWKVTGEPVGRRTVLSDFLVARGNVAVTMRRDGALMLRDRLTGRTIRELAHGEWQDAVSSADGKVLAAIRQREVALVDMATGKELRRQPTPKRRTNLVFAPDGKTIAWGEADGTFHVVETLTGKSVKHFGTPRTPTEDDDKRISFARDGTLLVQQGLDDGTMHLWRVASGSLLKRFRIPLNDDPAFLVVTLSPDNRTLAVGYAGRSHKGQVRLFEVLSGQERWKLDGHADDINALAFSSDGALLASASSDSTALLWDMNRRRKPAALAKSLTAADLARLWQDLAGNSERADDAHWALAHVPEFSVPFLKKSLQPATAAKREQIKKLINELGNDQFNIRQKALHDLEQLGEQARELLTKALETDPPLEVRQRIARLLDKLIDLPPDRLREARAVAVLERVGTPAARALLETLAKGVPDTRLTQEAMAALKRVAR
jgi:WD40 repeat protein